MNSKPFFGDAGVEFRQQFLRFEIRTFEGCVVGKKSIRFSLHERHIFKFFSPAFEEKY